VNIVDYEIRDPWGRHYIITLDLTYDGMCRDVLYAFQTVSQLAHNSTAGFYGLNNVKDPMETATILSGTAAL